MDNLRGKKRKVPADLIEETLEEEQQEFTGAGEDDISFKEFSNASCSNEISKSLSVLKYEYGTWQFYYLIGRGCIAVFAL